MRSCRARREGVQDLGLELCSSIRRRATGPRGRARAPQRAGARAGVLATVADAVRRPPGGLNEAAQRARGNSAGRSPGPEASALRFRICARRCRWPEQAGVTLLWRRSTRSTCRATRRHRGARRGAGRGSAVALGEAAARQYHVGWGADARAALRRYAPLVAPRANRGRARPEPAGTGTQPIREFLRDLDESDIAEASGSSRPRGTMEDALAWLPRAERGIALPHRRVRSLVSCFFGRSEAARRMILR